MMTGAPMTGVITLIGSTPLDGRLHNRLQSSAMEAPVIIVYGNSERCEPDVHRRRVICGVASPMKLMGPQNAVDTAVSKPVVKSSSWRMRVVLTPRF